MKLLLVTSVDAWTRSTATIHKWVETGRALGHDVSVYGEPNGELPALNFTTDTSGYDLALFVVQVPSDFPEMPYLARVLDSVPRERRVLADLWGRYNETIRIDHDFNHLEKLDGHLGWEWDDAFRSVSGRIVQPSLTPLRADVQPFLFHGFDSASIVKPHASAKDAAAAWAKKPLGMMYVGSNWQRWEQLRAFLEQYGKIRDRAGPAALVGWDWSARPDWAVEKSIKGVDTDPALLARLNVDIRHGVRFDEIVALLGQAKFAPVFHRPLFRHLGFVTNRSFETFYADTIPVLMLPENFVRSIYGDTALKLVPAAGVSTFLADAIANPEPYWDAVLRTRQHLAQHHSYKIRFDELAAIAKFPVSAGTAR